MKPQSAFIQYAVFVILVFFNACSQGDSQPTVPTVQDLSIKNITQQESNRTLWGVWQITLDPDTLETSVVPWRGAEDHWNARKWLENGPCHDCLKVLSVTDNPDGSKDFEVELTHPFSNPNLTGFDVRGIPMFNHGHDFGDVSVTIPTMESGNGALLNPAGYTYLYNYLTAGHGPGGLQGYSKGYFASATKPDSMINGYRRHISDDPANTRCALYAGDSVTEIYTIDMPDTFVFGYAVDASWAPPTIKPVTDPMEDFPPEANCLEPWKIFVNEFPIDAGLTDEGGWTRLVIDVYDHQGASTHGEPVIVCPEILTYGVIAEFKAAYSDHATYEAIITNEEDAVPGTYRCLISVLDDEYNPDEWWISLTSFQVINILVDSHTEDFGWSKTWGGIEEDIGYGVECDQYGNSYVTGSFTGVVDFNPGFYQDEHTSNGSTDVFLSKYNQSGDYQWTITFGGPGVDAGLAVAVGYDDGVYVAGKFQDTVDFDPDSGTENATSNGSADAFVAKYDWLDGHFYWVRTWGGSQEDVAKAVAVDTFHDSNIAVAGEFRGTVKFWPTTSDSVSNGMNDAYLIRFQPNGGFEGRLTWGGQQLDAATGVATDEDDNVMVCGYFSNNTDSSGIDFNPGIETDTHTSWGQTDAFLVKYDSTSDYEWGAHWGGMVNDTAQGVCMSPASSYNLAYVAGYFQGAIDFDPGSGEYFDASDGLSDAFLCRYSLDGVFDWERSWGGTGMDVAYDVDSHDYPAPFVTGYFSGSCEFDPGPPAVVGTSHGGTDVFFGSFTEDGAFSFARTWGGPDDDYGRACGAPYWQRYYITGNYSGTNIDMYPCEEEDLHTSVGGTDVFLTKFLWDGCW